MLPTAPSVPEEMLFVEVPPAVPLNVKLEPSPTAGEKPASQFPVPPDQ